MFSELGNDWTPENHLYSPEEKRELLVAAEVAVLEAHLGKASAAQRRVERLRYADAEELRVAHKEQLKRRRRR